MSSRSTSSRSIAGRGPRAVEALLLDAVASFCRPSGSAAPALDNSDTSVVVGTAARLEEMRRPLRIVVPSGSLRRHLSTVLVRRLGAMVGVEVVTHEALAIGVLRRAGEVVPRGEAFVDVLVRRRARKQPALSAVLDGLEDGYATVIGAVRDLLDAGLDEANADAVAEWLLGEGETTPTGVTNAALRRALAIVEVARESAAAMGSARVGRTANLLVRATTLMQERPALLPTRAFLVHGFADVTGAGATFLAALPSLAETLVFFDHPPDPGDPSRVDPSALYTARLQQSLSSLGIPQLGVPQPGSAQPGSPSPGIPQSGNSTASRDAVGVSTAETPTAIRFVDAPTPDAEIRTVALDLRQRLDAGAVPETLAVVARDLAPYRFLLRRDFDALGIPYSGEKSAGPIAPAGRLGRVFAELLLNGRDTSADAWLDALGALNRASGEPTYTSSREFLPDLRLGLRALGAARLAEVVALPVPDTETIALPAPKGLREDEDGEVVVGRRQLPTRVLLQAISAARRLLLALDEWPDFGTAAEHHQRLLFVRTEVLGWGIGPLGRDGVEAVLGDLGRDIPEDALLLRGEFLQLVRGAVGKIPTLPLGGAGGGVQVLTITEARARTFAHIALLGLTRDNFPRPLKDDPLFPDRLRARLLFLLPDLPIGARGAEEERYLFAQLCAAAPSVLLLGPRADAEGKALAPSPFAARLRMAGAVEVVAAAIPMVRPPEPDSPARPYRTPLEMAWIAGLYGDRSRYGEILPLALAETTLPGLDSKRLAAVRLSILDEVDPDRRTADGRRRLQLSSPYLGWIGSTRAVRDGRSRDPYLTAMEAMGTCGWEVFLRNILRLGPVPEPGRNLPDLHRALVGQIVHGVLEEVVKEAFLVAGATSPQSVGEARGRAPVQVEWPSEEGLERRVAAVTAKILQGEGITVPGFAGLYAAKAGKLLQIAQATDWGQGPVQVLGAEIEGEMKLLDAKGAERRVAFRADRLDAGMRLTDYKIGRPFADQKSESKRRGAFLKKMQAGEKLQAAAYARVGDPEAEGRFLFLDPDSQGVACSVEAGDVEAKEAVEGALRTVLSAWDQGVFFPRLVDGDLLKEPGRCNHCGLRDACTRGDSAARGRLVGHLKDWELEAPGDPEAAMMDLFRLKGNE